MVFVLSLKVYDGDDGMEDNVPSAEVTLTERSVPSLSLGFNVVEGVDEPGGDLELGGEDSRGEDMKFKSAGKMGVISKELLF